MPHNEESTSFTIGNSKITIDKSFCLDTTNTQITLILEKLSSLTSTTLSQQESGTIKIK